MIKVSRTIATVGDGLWSESAKKVHVTGLKLSYTNDDNTFGELRVYFNTDTWNVDEDGLIYTDSGWIAELKDLLGTLNLGLDIEYSEQGMQGRNYVSLDVGSEFIESYLNRMETA